MKEGEKKKKNGREERRALRRVETGYSIDAVRFVSRCYPKASCSHGIFSVVAESRMCN